MQCLAAKRHVAFRDCALILAVMILFSVQEVKPQSILPDKTADFRPANNYALGRTLQPGTGSCHEHHRRGSSISPCCRSPPPGVHALVFFVRRAPFWQQRLEDDLFDFVGIYAARGRRPLSASRSLCLRGRPDLMCYDRGIDRYWNTATKVWQARVWLCRGV